MRGTLRPWVSKPNDNLWDGSEVEWTYRSEVRIGSLDLSLISSLELLAISTGQLSGSGTWHSIGGLFAQLAQVGRNQDGYQTEKACARNAKVHRSKTDIGCHTSRC